MFISRMWKAGFIKDRTGKNLLANKSADSCEIVFSLNASNTLDVLQETENSKWIVIDPPRDPSGAVKQTDFLIREQTLTK